MTVVVILAIPDRRLSPNVTVGSRGQRMGKAKKIKDYRTAARLVFLSTYAASFRPRWKRALCVVKWFAKTRAFPDGDNALATLKPAYDGLTDAGLFDDDKGLTHSPVEFSKDPAKPRVEIHITNMITIPIDEFKTALRNHDWTYHMSEDPGVYRRGAAEGARLLQAAKDSTDEYKIAYNAQFAIQFHRKPYNPPYTFPFPEVLKARQ